MSCVCYRVSRVVTHTMSDHFSLTLELQESVIHLKQNITDYILISSMMPSLQMFVYNRYSNTVSDNTCHKIQ